LPSKTIAIATGKILPLSFLQISWSALNPNELIYASFTKYLLTVDNQ
jgi:hypothetical protein